MSCIGHCCEALFSVSAHHVCEIRPTLWTVLTLILILYTSLAVAMVTSTCTDHVDVWHKPASVCDKPGPILLSRALTTDPFRGITITAAFACALFYGYSPSISPVRIPLVGVLEGYVQTRGPFERRASRCGRRASRLIRDQRSKNRASMIRKYFRKYSLLFANLFISLLENS